MTSTESPVCLPMSARASGDANHFWITASSLPKGQLEPQDFLLIDARDGAALGLIIVADQMRESSPFAVERRVAVDRHGDGGGRDARARARLLPRGEGTEGMPPFLPSGAVCPTATGEAERRGR